MSRTRKVALILFVAVLSAAMGEWQHSSAIDSPVVLTDKAAVVDFLARGRTPSYTLVKKDWCDDLCTQNCSSGCEGSTAEGCNCYWVCENGDDGQKVCGGAIGVKICDL